MLGHEPAVKRDSRRASRLISVFLAVLSASPIARADAPRNADEPTPRGPEESITLSAERIGVWEEHEYRWILLEDHVAIFAGVDGIRADRAVVRVRSSTNVDDAEVHVLEAYAEGRVHSSDQPRDSMAKLEFRRETRGEIRIRASGPEGVITLEAAPRGLAILARAFRAKSVEPAETAPAVKTPPPGPPRAEPIKLPARRKKASLVDDASVSRTQFLEGPGFGQLPGVGTSPEPGSGASASPRLPDSAPDPNSDDFGPSLAPPEIRGPGAPDVAPPSGQPRVEPPTSLDPLPNREPAAPRASTPPEDAVAPIVPGSQRVTNIYPRSGGQGVSFQALPRAADGTSIFLVKGGVNIVVNSPRLGTVDIEADNVVVWRRDDPNRPGGALSPEGESIDSEDAPMEVYLEGNVVLRHDARKFRGPADSETFEANRAFYDFRNGRFIGLDAQVDLFVPGLIAPIKVKSPRIEQFHPMLRAPDGGVMLGLPEIRAEQTITTGSRFADPAYRFKSRSIDLIKVYDDLADPTTGKTAEDKKDTVWLVDARSNTFYLGPVPVFFLPRFFTRAEEIDPPLRQVVIRSNNYFGQQVLFDFDAFKVFNIPKPPIIDNWMVDVDYLSTRGVALGTGIGWFGKDIARDLRDPYHRRPAPAPGLFTEYAGYLDAWGLKDNGTDVLGTGPAVITQPADKGKLGFQRSSVPSFQDYRGRINFRHMQSLLGPGADPFEDAKINFEVGYLSDRQFLEQYYKRLFDTGLDHETLLYGIRQKDNWAFTVLAEANLQPFDTESQWLPKVNYYRLGDSLFDGVFTYYQNTGADWANTHTATEVNNPNIFAFIPTDPISNTSGVFKTARFHTAHQLDLPLNLDLLRVIPYVQGQAVGWTNQLDGDSLGRVWGAAGARASVMAWKIYPNAESELFNVHGLNHKVSFLADFRVAGANESLNRVGVQDDLDDNSFEFVRRYLALTTYTGGILPQQYDPRLLLLRRSASPITGSTDIQDTLQTLRLGLHQRLQTKRGPEGRRKIIDYMIFDLDTTYFTNADRDNFGKPFGQNMYNWEWYIGDRTSIVSTGWFEFFDIVGTPVNPDTKKRNDPFGLNIVTTGVSLARPPRGNIFIGYTVINTGPIDTSALNTSFSYWMSPKWYSTFGSMYDFGNAILLAANFSITRIGADYLTSVGLSVDPQRKSYMFVFEIAPRLSPSIRFGSSGGLTSLDTRFAPVQ